MKLLQDKVAIVTGAGSGIGREVAKLYAAEGAKVVVSDVNEKGGEETVDSIKGAGGEASFFRADSSKPQDNEALILAAVERHGALHIACNNAGIGGALAPTGEHPIDMWDQVIAVNLSGVFYGMRYQIPEMLKAGEGVIVNMGSILSQVGSRLSPAYVAAKHGLIGLTRTAALEYADKNIRVVAVGPAYIITPMVRNALTGDVQKALVGLHPMGRLGMPEEVAELTLWLSSPKASFITGSYYAIDGGYLSQ